MRMLWAAILAAAGLPLVIWASYLLLLALAASGPRGSRRKSFAEAKKNANGASMVDPGFLVLIPAHNEEKDIAGTVGSARERFLEAGWPEQIVVIADNCTDATAAAAGAAGADVLERKNPNERGKGYALKFAQEQLFKRNNWKILVIVDADTRLAPGFFLEMAEVYRNGARAAQAYYAARRGGKGWRPKLMEVAWSVFNYLRPLGRTALGSTSAILGNGFSLSREALERTPFQSSSLTEDIEHGLQLAAAGIRIEFAPHARVEGAVEETESTSRSQRVRWERGRFGIARKWIPQLLGNPPAGKRLMAAECALDLSVPPLVIMAGMILAWGLIGLISGFPSFAWAGLALLCVLGIITIIGMYIAEVPPSHLLCLLWVPWYLIWKISLYARPSFWRQTAWVRTSRGAPK